MPHNLMCPTAASCILTLSHTMMQAIDTQLLIEGKLEKKRKTRYGAPVNKRIVFFVDDINMPAKEKYGAQVRTERGGEEGRGTGKDGGGEGGGGGCIPEKCGVACAGQPWSVPCIFPFLLPCLPPLTVHVSFLLHPPPPTAAPD